MGSPALSSNAREPRDVARVDPAETRGKPGRHHHPGGHRLAVQPFAVADTRFDRVPERVAEIEQRALAGFALVGGDDVGLDPAALR